MPMGTLTFDAGGKPFNMVETSIPYAPLASSDFLLDNITVSKAGASPVLEPRSLALLGTALLELGLVVRRRLGFWKA